MFAKRIQSAKPSPTLAIVGKEIAMKAQGLDVIGLSAGEPDFDTPDNIKEAAIKAIKDGKTKYTPVNGTKEIKAAVIEKFKRENNLVYGDNEVIVGNGAKQIIFNALMALIDKDDEVIIPAPYWVSYPDMVLLAEGTPVIVNCPIENHFKMKIEDLEKAITPKTKCIILNSPSNPTGAVYSYEEIRKIADILMKHPNIYIISDDIYEHIVFKGAKFYTIAEVEPALKDRVITVNGLSKTYSMTGWRLGYGAGNASIIKAISILQSQSSTCACSISQAAGVEALNGPQDIVAHARNLFESRCDMIIDLLKPANELKVVRPQGAFYLFVNCEALLGKKTKEGKEILSSADFVEYLLEKHMVALVHGEAFGAPGNFRISYATSDKNLRTASERILNAVADLS